MITINHTSQSMESGFQDLFVAIESIGIDAVIIPHSCITKLLHSIINSNYTHDTTNCAQWS